MLLLRKSKARPGIPVAYNALIGSHSWYVLLQVDVLDAAALRNAFEDERWDTVLDCTLLPCMEEALQEIYIANLRPYVRITHIWL